MTREETILLYLALKQYLGKAMNTHWRDFKKSYRERRGWPDHCDNCGIKVKVRSTSITGNLKNTLTLDHIIPKSVLKNLELAELLFDDDNFALLCFNCNSAKSDRLPDSKDIPPQLLRKFHLAIDNRNRLV